jgi:hypothetical protein
MRDSDQAEGEPRAKASNGDEDDEGQDPKASL